MVTRSSHSLPIESGFCSPSQRHTGRETSRPVCRCGRHWIVNDASLRLYAAKIPTPPSTFEATGRGSRKVGMKPSVLALKLFKSRVSTKYRCRAWQICRHRGCFRGYREAFKFTRSHRVWALSWSQPCSFFTHKSRSSSARIRYVPSRRSARAEFVSYSFRRQERPGWSATNRGSPSRGFPRRRPARCRRFGSKHRLFRWHSPGKKRR